MKVLGFMRNLAGQGAVENYRIWSPLTNVDENDNGISATCEGAEAMRRLMKTNEEFGRPDIYVMSRTLHRDTCQPFIDTVHQFGGVLVLDSDDDLTETHRLVSGRGEDFKYALEVADYVTCSTPPLAELFKQWTQKPPVVLRNCVDVDWMRKVASNGKPPWLQGHLTIGFSGTQTHWRDWQVPSVAFARVSRDFPKVALITHGDVPSYLKHAHPDVRLPRCSFSIYPAALKHFDILLCAVDSGDRFNDGKSALKALEAMAIGVVPICSRFKPYMELEEAGAPVVIVPEDTPDGWYECMRALLQPDGFREALSAAGPEWVREHRDMVVSGYKQWESFFRSILE